VSKMAGQAVTVTAIVYAVAFTVTGPHLWHARNLRIPGGLLIAVAVSMAPLAVFGIQDWYGLWGQFGQPGTVHDFYVWIKGSWVFMEVAAIVAGVIALRFYPFPFIVLIIGVALWFMSMDLTPWIFGHEQFTWEERREVSMWFGLGVLVVAWIVDRWRSSGDFAFWLHLFGMMTFWGALSLKSSDSEIAKAIYCALNVGLVFLSVVLGRRVYAVFGTLGVAGYLGHLAESVFRDSMLFPFALSLIGVAVIAVGLLYHKHQSALAAWAHEHTPAALMRRRPAHARWRAPSRMQSRPPRSQGSRRPFLFRRHLLRNLARFIDEELRHRAQRPVLQGHDSDRPAGDRQFDRQLFDEGMPFWKLQPKLGHDRKKPARLQQIGPHVVEGYHARARQAEPVGAKRIHDE